MVHEPGCLKQIQFLPAARGLQLLRGTKEGTRRTRRKIRVGHVGICRTALQRSAYVIPPFNLRTERKFFFYILTLS